MQLNERAGMCGSLGGRGWESLKARPQKELGP